MTVQQEQRINNLPRTIYIALRTEEIRAEGRRNAFVFAEESEGNVTCIQEKIAWYEDVFTDPAMTMQGQPFAFGTSVRHHADGFVAGLRDAMQIVSTNRNGLAFHAEAMKAEGRRDAFGFVLQCQGDIAIINAEITKHETLLADVSDTDKRLHTDGYLAGLKDALKILQDASRYERDAVAPMLSCGAHHIDSIFCAIMLLIVHCSMMAAF